MSVVGAKCSVDIGLLFVATVGADRQTLPARKGCRDERWDTNGLFKRAYVKNRCIIPASGFYEWAGRDGDKTPHYLSAKDGTILAFAGIWERWPDENGEEVVSASIITREADRFMEKIHDRMPAMLHPTDFDAWLRWRLHQHLFAGGAVDIPKNTTQINVRVSVN